jgi:multidrug resistance protein, MATE family
LLLKSVELEGCRPSVYNDRFTFGDDPALNRPADATRPNSPPRELTTPSRENLLRIVLLLAVPVVAEQLLSSIVGTTDTWLANHLVDASTLSGAERDNAHAVNAAAGAAVGSVQYFLWLIGMISAAIGTGATALISRAVGARHRRLANAVCGQTVTLALACGAVVGVAFFVLAPAIARWTGLSTEAQPYLIDYMRWLGAAMPLTILMFAGGSCLRGAGDTLTPAIAMIAVNILNVLLSVGLTYGIGPLPTLGFNGIAAGTVLGYVAGGVIIFFALRRRGRFVHLSLARMIPHWSYLSRILRIGIPSGTESGLQWIANFVVVASVNHLGNVPATAHMIAIRIESFSFLTGMGFATAAATLVGQSLGMKRPDRARRSAYLCFVVGGGLMTLAGLAFVGFGPTLAGWMTNDAAVATLAGRCIQTTGLIQCGFAAAMIFGSALRGAGDTFKVMLMNLTNIFLIRFAGVWIVVRWFDMGLEAVWVVLSAELFIRGLLMLCRFRFGRWDLTRV